MRIEKGAWHGDIMTFKSLLPYSLTFIYSQGYISIGDIMTKIKRICEQCGREFKIFPSDIKLGRGKYCSITCYSASQRTRIKRACKICGKIFEVTPFDIRRGKGKYCSVSCRKKEQKTKITRICKICKKSFEVWPYKIKKGEGNFCSYSCARKAQKIPTRYTKPELIFEDICKRNSIDFQYTGDGALWIGEKGEKQLNPDFIEANGKRICVEIFGDYWHSPLLNRNMKEYAGLEYRKRHYRRYKWQSIYLWESDLKRKDGEQFVLNELKKVI